MFPVPTGGLGVKAASLSPPPPGLVIFAVLPGFDSFLMGVKLGVEVGIGGKLLLSADVAVLPSGSPLLRTYDVKAPPLPRRLGNSGLFATNGNGGGGATPCGDLGRLSVSSIEAKLSSELEESRLRLFGAS